MLCNWVCATLSDRCMIICLPQVSVYAQKSRPHLYPNAFPIFLSAGRLTVSGNAKMTTAHFEPQSHSSETRRAKRQRCRVHLHLQCVVNALTDPLTTKWAISAPARCWNHWESINPKCCLCWIWSNKRKGNSTFQTRWQFDVIYIRH